MQRWETALIACVAMLPVGYPLLCHQLCERTRAEQKADPYDEMIRNAYLSQLLKDHQERFDPKPSYALGDPLVGLRYQKQTWPR